MTTNQNLIKIFEYALNQEETGKSFFQASLARMGWGAAVSAFKRVIEEEEHHILFINNILRSLKRRAEAALGGEEAGLDALRSVVGALEGAIDLDPTNWIALINRAAEHLGSERFADAEEDLTRAIRLRPDAVARAGLFGGDVLREVETATRGTRVGQIFEGNRATDIVVLLDSYGKYSRIGDAQRIRKVCKVATGFIYYVSLTGVTGVRKALAEGLSASVKKIKRSTDKPVCVGFGVSTPEQAAEVAAVHCQDVMTSGFALTGAHALHKERRQEPA
mgnify:CR=1 FL=1